jgi:astacin
VKLTAILTLILFASYSVYLLFDNKNPIPPSGQQGAKEQRTHPKESIRHPSPREIHSKKSEKIKRPILKKRPPVNEIPRPIPQQAQQHDEKTLALQDLEGNIYPEDAVIIDDSIVVMGDIIAGRVEDLEAYRSQSKPLKIPPTKLWPNGKIPLKIDSKFKDFKDLQSAIKEIESKTNIRFPKRTDQPNYVYIKPGNFHCSSQVGMAGGEQWIQLSTKCSKGEILHELMHTIGFFHEQSRPDRDDYIQVVWENIEEKYHLQFKKILRWRHEGKSPFPFSFKTIMLYDSKVFSQVKGDYSMVTSEGDPFEVERGFLLEDDIKRINRLYPKGEKSGD